MLVLVSLISLLCLQDTVFKETAIDEVVVSSTMGSGKRLSAKGV